MEIYDIAMLVVVVAATIFGAIKGLAWQLASIASIVGSYAVAYRFRDVLAVRIDAVSPWNEFLAMLILFVTCSLAVWMMFHMATGVMDRLKLNEFDHHVGAVFGALKGGLYCGLATLFAITLCGDRVREMVLRSQSGSMITRTLARSEAVLPPKMHQFVHPYLQRIDGGERPTGQFAGDPPITGGFNPDAIPGDPFLTDGVQPEAAGLQSGATGPRWAEKNSGLNRRY